ncbi:MAG: T9SS type A sorting domain-containing protein [Bacteroidetes bacterium]|nr:T9SS type A sorting domain-containing protein [Bacteroidota bacterium]MBL7105155.1 T9SS type A sorting domain-containing protein [Bacteroidales bacterium]
MKKILFVSIFGLFVSGVFAQHQNVLISTSNVPEEPTIYINPKNTDQIVAGANIKNYYYSHDGGYTWNGGIMASSFGVFGDPCIIVDTLGDFYFFHLSSTPGGSFIDRMVCQKTTDIGVTWSNGTAFGLNGTKAQDKEWAVVDRTNNNIYVTWTQFDQYGSSNPNHKSIIRFSKSTDGGMTWSEAVKINEVDGDCIDDDNTVEGAVPAVGPNGEIYVAWAGPEGIVFDRSLDEGETWLDEDIFVTDFPGGWAYSIPGIMRCNGLPITVCDLSGGSNHGTIYINWSDQGNGTNDTDVWLVKSTDGGDTWSNPIRVNDDPPGKQQFFTWLAVDQVTGYLWFVWYDRRNYDDDNTDVYMAVSIDGGDTFINFKVSESPFLPYSGIFFGDYTNISVHNNIIRPIWTRLHSGQLSILTAIVDPDAVITAVEEELVQIPFAELEPNYPNPFIQSTYISFKLLQTGTVTLEIFDMYGKKVATLINNELRNAGKYIEHFDANNYRLSSGVYYFSLTGEKLNLKRKMMLVN